VVERSLDDLARALIAPLQLGDRVGHLGLAAIVTDLAIHYELRGDDAVAIIEVIPRDGARGEKVTTRHFAIGHRAGTIADRTALELCRIVADRIGANEDAALATMRAAPEPGDRIRSVRTEHALVAAHPLTHYTLSPYRGCTIGCTFCYAQSRLQPMRTLLGLAPAQWGSWVDAHVDMPDALARELATLPVAPIKLCPIVADPYQAIERRLRITRRCLETIAASPHAWPMLVLTRAREILEDLPLIVSLPRAWVGISLPTIDDDVRRHFEPRAASVDDRLEVLRQFTECGVETFAVVQPMLPGDIDALADALLIATAGVAIGTLEGEEQSGPLFDAFATARDPAWQRDQATRLRDALLARDIPVWTGELPPELLA
jgi:DNA repair photolyase